MSDFTPIRLGVRKDEAFGCWRLEIALAARKDLVPDAEDVVRMADAAYQSEESAMEALAQAIFLD